MERGSCSAGREHHSCYHVVCQDKAHSFNSYPASTLNRVTSMENEKRSGVFERPLLSKGCVCVRFAQQFPAIEEPTAKTKSEGDREPATILRQLGDDRHVHV